MNLFHKIEQSEAGFVMAVGLLLIAVIGLLDYATGNEMAFSLFYVLPISLVTWRTAQRTGTLLACLSAGMWLLADVQNGHGQFHVILYLWNTLIRLGFLLIIVHLLSMLRQSLDQEQKLSRTDPLTGAVNTRHFEQLLQAEINRSQRYQHSFTLVYLDVDNFKKLNDRFGHSTGDEALKAIVHYTLSHLRQTDVMARMGGDEFAILLPETDQHGARSAISKLQHGLMQMAKTRNWPITFSIGVMSCNKSACVPDQVISVADRLMYSVKHNGKNSVLFMTCPEECTAKPFSLLLPVETSRSRD